MLDKIPDDPRIDIKCVKNGYETWMLNATVRELEAVCDDITIIDYFHLRFKGSNNTRKIVEEMIHLCLPDPDAYLGTGREIFGTDDPSWKHCFYELLDEDK